MTSGNSVEILTVSMIQLQYLKASKRLL